MKTILLIFLLISHLALCAQKYKKVVHSTDASAKCLDGTSPALYIHQGSVKDSILIYFQGGSYCYGETQNDFLNQCYERSKTSLGSSTHMASEYEGQGILSTDPQASDFASWTKIIFTSCDGSLYQGFRTDPIKYKTASLYFRGSNITKSNFAYIQKQFNVSKASKIVLAGSGSGAMALTAWSGYFRQHYQSDTSKVHHILDSGMYIDWSAYNTTTSSFATSLKYLFSLANIVSYPFQVCSVYYPGSEWKCMLPQYNYQFLVGNFLYINSQYDVWAIANILKIKCLTPSTYGSTLTKCTSNQIEAIQKYRYKYQITAYTLLQTHSNSIWSIACANTNYLIQDAVYADNNCTTGSTVQQIVENIGGDDVERIVNMDMLPWPYNQACAK